MSSWKGCAVTLLTMLASAEALAARQQFNVIGSVTKVPASLTSQFTVGQPITGTYTFESDAADRDPSPLIGDYVNSISGFDLNIGSYALTTSLPGDINITPGSYIATVISRGSGVGDMSPIQHSIQLEDSTASAFDSDVLGTQSPDLNRFGSRLFTIDFIGTSFDRLEGRVDSIFPVPEPALLAVDFVAMGLAAWGAIRRRSRR